MKKVFVLSLLAMAAFVSQAWAAYAACTGEYAGFFCLYASGDCWGIDQGQNDDPSRCQTEYNNCKTNAWIFTGVPSTGVGAGKLCTGGTFKEGKDNNPPGAAVPSSGCCKYAGVCWDTHGESEAADCQTGTNTFWAGECPDKQGTCPSTPPTYDGGSKPSLGCCKWANTTTNPDGKCWAVSDAAEAADCQTGDNQFWSSACPDGQGTCPGSAPTPPVDPILKFTPASQALIVAPYGRSLHISSAREAIVSLYDMSGARVYSGRVSAGNRVFSLGTLASGSYYAVVQSGSDAKKVPVILK